MTELNYTKGEWKVRMSATGERQIYVNENNEMPEIICRDVRHYNMNLISAAPDMYESGQGLDLAIGQTIMKLAETSGINDDFMNAIQKYLIPAQEKWRTALAKAEGKG